MQNITPFTVDQQRNTVDQQRNTVDQQRKTSVQQQKTIVQQQEGVQQRESEEASYSSLGGVIGFVFYWLAFAIPFFVYGPNTVFFLLYTWPFFLALMPVSVLIGIALSVLSRGYLLLTIAGTGVAVVCLFWMLFSFLTGW